jgi:hypothetical protein
MVGWFRDFPSISKLVIVGLVLLVLLDLLSPVAVTICVLLIGVSIVALIIRVAQRRSVRNWAIVAVASVVLVATFGGIWGTTVHGGGGSASSGQGGSGGKADSATSDDGGAYTPPSPSPRPFDKDADFSQSYEEADDYLRAAQLNVPEHEVPAAAVAGCRTLTFVRETETPQALVEDQVDSIYDEMGAANYVGAADIAGLPQYEEKCDRVWAWYRVYREASR